MRYRNRKTDFAAVKENVRIVDFARELGFTPQRKGKYYTLKEHDSVMIDPARNIFIRNSTGDAGSIIDFAMCFGDYSLSEAIQLLEKKAGGSKEIPDRAIDRQLTDRKEVPFSLPMRDAHAKNVFAYLLKTRGIEKDVIDWMMHEKYLFQDKRKNCVFVSYKEGKAVFACRRGTNTDHPFYGDVPGCDYDFLFFIENGSENLLLTESVIDTLSVMSLLHMEGKSFCCFNYLSLAGCRKFEPALKYHLKERRYQRIILCLDRDSGGKKAAEDICSLLKELEFNGCIYLAFPVYGKDMNEDLIEIRKGERFYGFDRFCREQDEGLLCGRCGPDQRL